MGDFYDGTKILSLNDIDNEKPEIYMVSTNRSGGKTTYFGKMLVNRFIKSGKKFLLLYRYSYEIEGKNTLADKFFRDLQGLFFPTYEMESHFSKMGFTDLILNGVPCGYGTALNKADSVKKLSHLFSDVDSILFDEFQSENGNYVPNEIQKFISIHTSVARGQGKSHRYVPVYMLSNPVSIINPYYCAFGVDKRLQSNTKFLRGPGWVCEQGFVEQAAQAQKKSGFNKAFADNDYIKYSQDGIYLDDNLTFIETPQGKFQYFVTLKYNNECYSIKYYTDLGICYVDDSYDKTFPWRHAITNSDMDVNYADISMIPYLMTMRKLFHAGRFRFKNIKCKHCLLTALGEYV